MTEWWWGKGVIFREYENSRRARHIKRTVNFVYRREEEKEDYDDDDDVYAVCDDAASLIATRV